LRAIDEKEYNLIGVKMNVKKNTIDIVVEVVE
jgi:hypothetical protein